MKNNISEHKKGVKAIKYSKKPQPLVGPEALKKKAKAKAPPPTTELEKHSTLSAKLKEDVDFQFDMKLAKILKERGYKGPIKLEQLGMKWIEAVGNIVDIDDGIMVKGRDPEYDSWVAYVYETGQYAYGAEQGYQTGDAKSVERNTREQGVAEGSGGVKYKIKSIGKDSKGDYYISPNTGKKVYKQAKVGDHETPRGEVKPNVAEGSVQDKLHKRHQELRKKSGLPDPDYYKELKATYDLPDDERYAKAAELKKKYKIKEAKRPDRPPPKTDLKVGDHVTADTSKEDYPGGHKSRSGKVTRVGQQGVHIKTDDSDEPEWHPYKIVKKSESSMKEAKQPEVPKPRNFVAKNAKTAGAGKHKDAKKAMKDVRGQKHKNKEMAEDSLKEYGDTAKGQKMLTKVQKRAVDRVTSKKADTDSAYAKKNSDTAKRAWDRMTDVAETYDQARAARIRYALMLQEGEWDQQSDEIIPPQYDMDPEELKAIRNAEFSEEDKIQAMIKLAAGGTSDEDIAKIYDMDKETVASILDDYIEDIEAEMEPDDNVKEAEMGKVIDYKPGQTATINTGPGMTTILDLKKNPTSLTKDPASGKLKLVSTPQTTSQPSATTQSTVKAGDPVEIGKVESIQDILKLSGLK